MNGQGYYKSVSGYCYEGIFVNGIPKDLSSKLKIEFFEKDGQTAVRDKIRLKIIEGKTLFGIKVVSLNEKDEICKGNLTKKFLSNYNFIRIELILEDGRKIQLRLAVKLDINTNIKFENEIRTEL
jgi:hypothetical protein